MEKTAFKVPHPSLTAPDPNEDFLLPLNADIDTGDCKRNLQCPHTFYISFDVEKM